MNKGKLIKICLTIFCLVIVLFMTSIRHIEVDGESMLPTLHDNEKIWVKKRFLNEGYKRFDIIIADNPLVKNEEVIKRIIGLPNETIYAKNGVIYINGIRLGEPMTKKGITSNFGPIKISEDEYYVLGDNREKSTDSRAFGSLKMTHINAKMY